MGLKEALIANKQRLDEITNTAKLQKMLQQQQDIISGIDDAKEVLVKQASEDALKVKREKKLSNKWNPDILDNGGVSYYFTEIDGKPKKVRVALAKGDCDVVLSYHCRIADGTRFSVAGKNYSDSQKVVDEIYGAGLYRVSGSTV